MTIKSNPIALMKIWLMKVWLMKVWLMKMYRPILKFYWAARLSSMICVTSVQAAVIMVGTRVIFPADQNEKTIQFQNKDKTPNIVQLWLDSGDERLTAENADAPFFATPQIFKTGAFQGQIVRLTFTGDRAALPTDKESLFYLNFSEIPSSKSADTDKNKMLIIFRNRVKLFYRPAGLAIQSFEINKHISYKFIRKNSNDAIEFKNNSPYYANISEASLSSNDQKTVLAQSIMVAPGEAVQWDLNQKNLNPANMKLHIGILNDYGVAVVSEVTHNNEH